MEHGFLSQKGSGGGKGVKEKNLNRNKMNTSSGIGVSMESDVTLNEDTPVGVAYTVQEYVTPSMVDMMAEMEKISSLDDTTAMGSFPPLSTLVTTMAGNAPGKSSYADVTSKPSGKKVNFHTLFTPRGKRVAYPIVANYGRSSYARAMIKLRADIELKDNIVVAMPKITREGHYTCNIRVEYEWKPPRCASCKVFRHNHEECIKNTGADETKNLKKTNQAPKGISVGPKVRFKPTKEYRHVPKKHTAKSSGNKKKGVDSTNKVSDSNPFVVLSSFDNDVEIGVDSTNKVSDSNPFVVLSSFDNDVEIEYPSDHDSKDEVASVNNDMARNLASERTRFGTQSLLEKWRDSYGNGDYDEDPWDDDMYEGQDLSE
nr:hypothetical protein [Tanacetum cinerariifolium]